MRIGAAPGVGTAVAHCESQEGAPAMKSTLFSVIGALVITFSASVTLAKATPAKSAAQVIEISVTGEGFIPAQVKVKAGQPVRLIVTARRKPLAPAARQPDG
jgi:plastocyanin domain-containing protein